MDQHATPKHIRNTYGSLYWALNAWAGGVFSGSFLVLLTYDLVSGAPVMPLTIAFRAWFIYTGLALAVLASALIWDAKYLLSAKYSQWRALTYVALLVLYLNIFLVPVCENFTPWLNHPQLGPIIQALPLKTLAIMMLTSTFIAACTNYIALFQTARPSAAYFTSRGYLPFFVAPEQKSSAKSKQ